MARATSELTAARVLGVPATLTSAHTPTLARYMATTGLLQRALSALLLLLIATPGVLFLAPVLWYVEPTERALAALAALAARLVPLMSAAA